MTGKGKVKKEIFYILINLIISLSEPTEKDVANVMGIVGLGCVSPQQISFQVINIFSISSQESKLNQSR